MKNSNLLIILFLSLCSACQRDELDTTTTLEGTVYDYITKKPFPGVLVELSGKETYAQGLANYYSDTCTTDSLGKYNLSVNTPISALMVGYINVPGYFVWKTEVIADPELLPGRNYKREITLYKNNAYVKGIITNETGIYNSIYNVFWSKADPDGYYFVGYPAKLKNGESKSVIKAIPGNLPIYIAHDFEKFYPSNGDYPNLDSIIVHPGDTGVYEIKF